MINWRTSNCKGKTKGSSAAFVWVEEHVYVWLFRGWMDDGKKPITEKHAQLWQETHKHTRVCVFALPGIGSDISNITDHLKCVWVTVSPSFKPTFLGVKCSAFKQYSSLISVNCVTSLSAFAMIHWKYSILDYSEDDTFMHTSTVAIDCCLIYIYNYYLRWCLQSFIFKEVYLKWLIWAAI